MKWVAEFYSLASGEAPVFPTFVKQIENRQEFEESMYRGTIDGYVLSDSYVSEEVEIYLYTCTSGIWYITGSKENK